MAEYLKIFLTNLGGTTVGVLGLGLLCKTWISALVTEGIKAEYGEVLEILKARLLNDAKIQDKQVAALVSLHVLLIDMMPARESEDQDWEDAVMIVGFDISKHQASLQTFDKEFGILLPESVRSMLSEARNAANDANIPQSIGSIEDVRGNMIRKGSFARKMVDALMEARQELEKDVFGRTVAVK